MNNVLGFIKSIFTKHKMKMFMFSLLTSVFTFLFFPFGDLSDKLTAEVAKASNNQVYIQFDNMALAMMPQPALKMSNVVAEFPQMPELALSELSVAPSLFGLIKRQIMGRVYGQGFFKGDLDLNLAGSSKIKGDGAMSANLDYSGFNLKDIFKTLQKMNAVPMTISGTGEVKAQMDFDPAMKTQPDGDVSVLVKNMSIPAFNVPLAQFGGSIPLPGLNLDKVQLKGKMKNGKLTINETNLGSPKNELSGKISGDMDVRVYPNVSHFDFGAYNFAVDITLLESLQTQLGPTYMGLIDTMIGKYKKASATGTRYSFRMQARSFQEPPQFSPL